MHPEFASFIRVLPHLESATETGGFATVRFGADEPVLSGHYPGVPIVPGVCLLELIHQTVRQLGERRGAAVGLTALRSARFLIPVFPGTMLGIAVEIQDVGAQWHVTAVVTAAGERAAVASLVYDVWRAS